jgi:hypothetical protein
MKNLRCALIAAALALSAAARADVTEATVPAEPAEHFYLDYNVWNYKVSGRFDFGGSTYDLSNGFDTSRRSRALYRLRWDWQRPDHYTWLDYLKPDLAASFGRIEVSGQRAITTNVIVGPLPIPVTSNAFVATNVRDLDATARWPLLQLGWARLSGGLTLKQLKGNVLITDSAATPPQMQQPVNALFPMVHAFFEVPLGGRLRVGIGGDWITGDGNEAHNVAAIARFKVIGPLDLIGGWQGKRYKVRTKDSLLDARLQGWQFGGELAF